MTADKTIPLPKSADVHKKSFDESVNVDLIEIEKEHEIERKNKNRSKKNSSANHSFN
jgi:hypothetical protein